MNELPAVYYPPGSSRALPARIGFVAGAELQLDAEGVSRRCALAELKVDERIGNVPRRIVLPDGATLEVADNDALDAALHGGGLVHRLESRLPAVAAALVLTVVVVWGLIQYGLPAAAGWIARIVPPEMDASIGAAGLELLDRTFLHESTLAPQRRAEISRMFEQIAADADDGHRFRLLHRSGIGPNALALPSGIVIVTDELVALAQNDDELRAVLAHEVGHVVHRHTLRSVLQNSSVVLVVAAITGDITVASSVAGGLPTLLLEARYSRQFEREADAYARDWMARNDVHGDPLGTMLQRLREESGGDGGGFLSSHPATDERVQAADPGP